LPPPHPKKSTMKIPSSEIWLHVAR